MRGDISGVCETVTPAMLLSIVIPTLDAAETLGAVIQAIKEGKDGAFAFEIIVVDGGSGDETAAIGEGLGARVIEAPRGRGSQLIAGADAATGEWMMFLHADTRLGPGWMSAAARFAGDAGNQETAAVFRYALDDGTARARRIEWLVGWRCRLLALPYGDQGLLIGRAFYEALGGFKPIELMEDVDIVRRIGRQRLRVLDVPAITSAVRYEAGGYVLRPLLNLFCLSLYLSGVPVRLIARIYR